MFKKILTISTLLIATTSCSYDTGGVVPEKKSNPTLSENILVSPAFFDQSRVEKRSYSQFAKDKCVENGYKNGYEGYAVSKWYTGGWVILGVLPVTDGYKTAKIWCKK